MINEKKIVLEGEYENVIKINDHYLLINKKQKVCVLPYTISTEGLLNKVAIIKSKNLINDQKLFTLINGYITTDDGSDLICANRLLFETININITDAARWSYLGIFQNNVTLDCPLKIYAVNLTSIEIPEKEAELAKKESQFYFLDSNKVVQSDDSLLLAAYFRLFQTFYITSLEQE